MLFCIEYTECIYNQQVFVCHLGCWIVTMHSQIMPSLEKMN